MGIVRNSILLLLLMGSSTPSYPAATCTLDPSEMPESWRPSGTVQGSLNGAPRSAAEAKDAAQAVQAGLRELSDFFANRPDAVLTLRDNAVEPLIDISYAA